MEKRVAYYPLFYLVDVPWVGILRMRSLTLINA